MTDKQETSSEPTDYRRQVVWLVPYPASFGTPTTTEELRTAALWAIGAPYWPLLSALGNHALVPRGSLMGLVRGAYDRLSPFAAAGWCQLCGAAAGDRGEARERVVFYEATPEGIEVSAPFGDDFTHAIVATWAFALSEVFGEGMRPMRESERHAWRAAEFGPPTGGAES